jgi:hypothetical protein
MGGIDATGDNKNAHIAPRKGENIFSKHDAKKQRAAV